LTWWGTFLMAALDASLVFYLPFGVDALVIFQSARNERLFWIYPVLATAGSLAGAAITFWFGRKAGESGLERFVPPRRLDALRRRVRNGGAVAMAIPAFVPPPFPLTPFILTCGALAVSPRHFFTTFAIARLLRFGFEAILARVYGAGVVRILESEQFRMVVGAFVVIATIGTIVSAWLLWRASRRGRASLREPARPGAR
jgi:membrane protein YqaA with SNARE-associated domain